MKQAIILNSENWSITSYGNGLAYCFENKIEQAYVFLQGDDASQFWQEYSDLNYTMSDNQAFAELWNNYGCIATYLEGAE